MKIHYSGQAPGTWLVDVRPWWWLRIRFRVFELDTPGPGPTININLPWYHGVKILHFHLKINVFVVSKDIEWNVKAT